MTSITQKTKLPKFVRVLIALAFWLGLWQLAAFLVGKELILPGPVAVVRTLARLCVTGDFWAAAGLSLLRIFCGFALGVLVGTGAAVLSCLTDVCDAILAPAMRLARTTPVASFIILLLLWTGRDMVPVIVPVIMVAPVLWQSVKTAAAGTDPALLEMARMYRFGRGKSFRLILLPTVRPAFHSACITALGLAWKSGVAAEVLCLPRLAVGTSLYYSKLYLETPGLFAWTAVVILLSWLLEKLVLRLAKGKGARL